MLTALYTLIAWALGSLIGRVLVGAGLTLVVYSGVGTGVEYFLDSAVTALSGMPAAVLQLALLAGVGEALSILGSALMTRVALTFAGNVAGLRKT